MTPTRRRARVLFSLLTAMLMLVLATQSTLATVTLGNLDGFENL